MEWGAVPPEAPGELALSPEQRLMLPNFPLCCDGVQGFFFFFHYPQGQPDASKRETKIKGQ